MRSHQSLASVISLYLLIFCVIEMRAALPVRPVRLSNSVLDELPLFRPIACPSGVYICGITSFGLTGPSRIAQLSGVVNPYTSTYWTPPPPTPSPMPTTEGMYAPGGNLASYPPTGAGAPTYDSNTVFWVSRESRPGQSVLLSGAFTGSTSKTVRVAFVPPGTTDWQSLVEHGGTTVNATSLATLGLSFLIPSWFQQGVYAFEIDDPSLPSDIAPARGLVNQPSIDWVQGVPASITAGNSPLHSVIVAGGEAGQTLRIFGKNFTASEDGTFLNHVFVSPLSSLDTHLDLTITSHDADSITLSIPTTLKAGPYYLWVGDSKFSDVSSAAVLISIMAPSQLESKTLQCRGIQPDTDITHSLQACLDANAPNLTAPTETFFSLGAGTYTISSTIVLHPHEYLYGAGLTSTVIEGKSTNTSAPWISGTNYFGLIDLAIIAPIQNTSFAIVQSDMSGDTRKSGHIRLFNASITGVYSGSDVFHANEVNLSGPDVQIINSVFDGTGTIAYSRYDGALISGNVFNGIWNETGDSQNLIIENNKDSGFGLAVSIDNSGPSRLSQNIYLHDNFFTEMTTDGGGGAYWGAVVSASSDSIVLANYPVWTWMGTTFPPAAVVTIIGGRGVGQYRTIQKLVGTNTITVTAPFDVLPDSTSIVCITPLVARLIVTGNTFTIPVQDAVAGGQAAVQFYGNVRDSVIENNTVINGSIDVQTMNDYGGGNSSYLSTLNVDVLNNTGLNSLTGPGGANSNSGVILAGFPGTILSGVLVRGNSCDVPGTIAFSNDFNLDSSVLIEDNACPMARYTDNWLGDNSAIEVRTTPFLDLSPSSPADLPLAEKPAPQLLEHRHHAS